MAFSFEILATDPTGARLGRLTTPHGVIETPAFMPVGTAATVKSQTQQDLETLGAQIILSNTYHLYLRPGHDLIRRLGGLHQFMSWPRAILTDSGGYQVFSLGDLRKVTDDGVLFRSHLDGSEHFLSPEKAMEIEIALGADIIMVLDECIEAPAPESRARDAATRTLAWARRSKDYFQRHGDPARQALFGIVQGGTHLALRRESAESLVALDFPGYAIGGLAVGEPHSVTCEVAHAAVSCLPAEKPRYLMGVGKPEQLPDYVPLGIDMMDCVLPTRSARHGCLFTSRGRLLIRNAQYANDPRPIDESCSCAVCRRYSRAYLRHLYVSGESLASILNTHHNLFFYLDIMREIREAIRFGKLERFRSDLQARLQ
ncbi:MAG TPA: tRNA guanosine(34) transglycosylase Tgt [Candidatus Baltobacteraceae bacterium]|nr:tRNA guanosine(34) transglycosylase Tgt [Verrucomicrobiae bacterium]HTX14061.1 tRNA guanosine(34) transglycosylase Tgt [Candidatus Baltobacteraceae bacterium]